LIRAHGSLIGQTLQPPSRFISNTHSEKSTALLKACFRLFVEVAVPSQTAQMHDQQIRIT
jgi:hypothetical protein